jgi:transposase
MSQDYPPWKTGYEYFKKWRVSGTGEEKLDILNQKDQPKQGRQTPPSYGIIDSQSIKI